jgi:exodeoxyribonuclease V gamma subunit
LLEDIAEVSSAIARAAKEARAGDALPLIVGKVKLPGGIDLEASVDCRFAGGIVVATYSRLKPKGVLASWLRHLAASALGAAKPSYLVGRDPKNSDKVRVIELLPQTRDEARARLDELVAWFWRGQRVVLPFLPAPSAAYARVVLAKKPHEMALDEANGQYKTEPDAGGGFDAHAVRAFDQRVPPFDAMFDRGERALDETLFHEVALSVHGPLFQAGGLLG